MLASKIKQYLDDKGITQAFVSEKTGMKAPILSATLSGKRRLLAEEYINICNALEVSADYFATSEDNKAS